MKKMLLSLLLVFLLMGSLPVRQTLPAGGGVCYRALFYQVTKFHRYDPEQPVKPYVNGLEIKLLGIPVYLESH